MLTADFFARDTIEVARQLVGTRLHVVGDVEEMVGRIVETEAYLGAEDPASHAAGGPTPRSEIMFGPPAVAYVYFIYGVHHCLNFVTETEGRPGAVLVRALEPMAGMLEMARARGLAGGSHEDSSFRNRNLCNGPGKLCQALGINKSWNGVPLNGTGKRKIWLAETEGNVELESTSRIGIRTGTELPFRFVDPASDCLSR